MTKPFFSDLPASKQKEIIKSAARAANKDQRELIKKIKKVEDGRK